MESATPDADSFLIEALPPMRVACYRAISTTPEQDAEHFLAGWLIAQAVETPVRRFGFAIEVPTEHQKRGQRGYETWATIPDGIHASDGVTIRAFAGGTYATLTLRKPCSNDFKKIAVGWKRLHHWVIESDCCRSANHQWLEEIMPQANGCDLRLYHPILLV